MEEYIMKSIIENFRKDTYPILFGILVIAIGTISILTVQLLAGLVLLIIIAVIAIVIYGIRSRNAELATDDDIVIILSGVIVAFLAMAIAPWFAWATAFMFLFLFQKSFTRIERRLDSIEPQCLRRNLRRRSRKGTGGYYR
jgi:hypothetical protein